MSNTVNLSLFLPIGGLPKQLVKKKACDLMTDLAV